MITMVTTLVQRNATPESNETISTLNDQVVPAESKTGRMTQTDEAPPAVKKIVSSDDGTAKEETEESDDDDHMPQSQATLSQPLSQTDETIRRLEKEGELDQVVGSQSMLSQELICSSQRTQLDEEDDGGFQLSQATETSVAMAKRLGLLSQDDHKDDSIDRSTSPEPTIAADPAPSVKAEGRLNSSSKAALMKTPPPAAKPGTITDTPFRESECFGSLLEAVEKITREEEMSAKMIAWQHSPGSDDESSEADAADDSHNPQEGSRTRKAKRKLRMGAGGSPSSSPKKSRKTVATKKKEQEQRKSQEVAKRAAGLAEQTITDPEMAKKLLLSMALVRENPRSVPSVLPPRGAVVPEGFFWAHYPPLEAVLKKHMAEYYDLSTTKCQSAQQQAFNNDLVILVRDVAKQRGWKFHQTFTDKGLRDRIRCYYKTHIQNAKKRLRTMVRNPTKRANARHLCAHLDLIEKHGTDGYEEDEPQYDSNNEAVPKKLPSTKASGSDPRMAPAVMVTAAAAV